MSNPATVEEHLRLWGDWQLANGSGSRTPKGLNRDFTRGSANDLESIASYVENTPGYGKAQAALAWVYVALAPEEKLFDYDLDHLAQFRRNLRTKIKKMAWQKPTVSEVLFNWDIGGQIAEKVSAEVDSRDAGLPSLR